MKKIAYAIFLASALGLAAGSVLAADEKAPAPGAPEGQELNQEGMPPAPQFAQNGMMPPPPCLGPNGMAQGQGFGPGGMMPPPPCAQNGMPQGQGFGPNGMMPPPNFGQNGMPQGQGFGPNGMMPPPPCAQNGMGPAPQPGHNGKHAQKGDQRDLKHAFKDNRRGFGPMAFCDDFAEFEKGSMPRGFEKEAAPKVTSVADALKAKEDTRLFLKGKLTKYLGDETYEFTDGNDSIAVILSHRHHWSHIAKDMPIEIIAEVSDNKVTKELKVKAARPEMVQKPQPRPQDGPAPAENKTESSEK